MEEDNEAEFLAALVASERVAAWLDTLRGFKQHGSLPRARTAVRELKQALEAEVYAQEVRGGVIARQEDACLHRRRSACRMLAAARAALPSRLSSSHQPTTRRRPGARAPCPC